MTECSVFLADEAATVMAGHRLAQALSAQSDAPAAMVIYLQGNLGTGKTTLSRGLLQALGHAGHVKSPTYTLVEPYHLPSGAVYHFDLYRLRDAAELEYLGVEEYFQQGRYCLVEWPEKGAGMIPSADISLSLQTEGTGRRLMLSGISAAGKKAVEAFSRLVK